MLSQTGTTSTGEAVFLRDKDILMARRIDWRFLLPSPELNNVVYIGSPGTELQESLTRFSRSLTALSPDEANSFSIKSNDANDLAVICSSHLSAVKNALPLIKKKGLIYWEVKRRGKKILQPRDVRKYLADLDDLHLREVELYWHRPNFERCMEIIPLKKQALQHAFAKSHSSLKGKAKIAVGRILLNTGLLFYLVPCFSLIARKP